MGANLDLFIRVTIALIVIVVMAQFFGRLIKFIGQPSVVGEMMSGVILGPTVFGYFFPGVSKLIFPGEIMPLMFFISNLGLSIYMFIIGSELNLKLFTRKTLKDSTALSLAAIVVPFLLGGLAGLLYNDEVNTMHIDNISFMIYVGTALAITAFPTLARILHEKNIVNTRLGALSILSASIQDVVSWILLGFVTIMCTSKEYSAILLMISGVFVLLILLFYVIRPALSKLAVKVTSYEDLSTFNFGIVVLLLLICALITDVLGLYSVFGGFILGLSMPRKGFYIQAISMRIKDITLILLLPVFFTYSGLNTNLLKLVHIDLVVPAIVIFFFAFASKYLSCTLTMRWVSRFSWRESSAIGALLNSRGLMELIVANIGLTYGLIDGNMYSILVLIAVGSTLAALPLYNWSMGKRIPG